MVSVHYNTSEERKIWSHIGLVFATIYAVLISINYYVQLTFVVPRLLQGDVDSISSSRSCSFPSIRSCIPLTSSATVS